MGADASLTQTTFFIASLVVAASLAGVVMGVSHAMANEVDAKAKATADQLGTDLIIINDPRSMPYTNGEMTLYVKNIGDKVLRKDKVTIMADGVLLQGFTVSGDNMRWSPGTVAEYITQIELDEGDHVVKVVTDNGISHTMAFRL